MSKNTNKKKEYWYRTNIEECPVCGEFNVSKERVYHKDKPNDPTERRSHCYLTHYCWV